MYPLSYSEPSSSGKSSSSPRYGQGEWLIYVGHVTYSSQWDGRRNLERAFGKSFVSLKENQKQKQSYFLHKNVDVSGWVV